MNEDGPLAEVLATHEQLAERFAGLRSPVIAESTNQGYGAFRSHIGDRAVRYRVAKVTPRKLGLFVAVWERANDGGTQPLSVERSSDLLVVVCRDGAQRGTFVFPASVLRENGIIAVAGEGGKRGFRLYPPWCEPDNAQARRTQKWQLPHFILLSDSF